MGVLCDLPKPTATLEPDSLFANVSFVADHQRRKQDGIKQVSNHNPSIFTVFNTVDFKRKFISDYSSGEEVFKTRCIRWPKWEYSVQSTTSRISDLPKPIYPPVFRRKSMAKSSSYSMFFTVLVMA